MPKNAQFAKVIPLSTHPDTQFVTLAGNPNSGTTSLFNALTGAFQHVATSPGVTVAVIRRESGSWGWAAFQFFSLTLIAWVLTFIIFQAGTLAGLGV